jgi:hypothetical protein
MIPTHQICVNLTDVCNNKSGSRDRQLLLGDGFVTLDIDQGWAFGHATKDGYRGYVRKVDLEPFEPKTHRVRSLGTHAYNGPDIKSSNQIYMPFGSLVSMISDVESFVKTKYGFIPKQHLMPIGSFFPDPVQVALLFLHAPYLWGGNSVTGIDCSGLIQTACLACGKSCPGDSGPQQTAFTNVDGPWNKNQLIFWKGHVALTINDGELIHANARAMAVTIDEIEETITRIAKAGDGPIINRTKL